MERILSRKAKRDNLNKTKIKEYQRIGELNNTSEL